MIFRNAQRSNKCTYLRIVTRRPELIYPTRTDPQRMSRKKHIFDSTGAVHTRPPLSRLIRNDNQSRSMIIATIRLALPAFLQTGFVALGKSSLDTFIQFGQFIGILNGSEMPCLQMHPARRISSSLQNSLQILFRDLLTGVSPYTSTCFDIL